MNQEHLSLLAELGKDVKERNPEKIKRLATLLCSPENNEIKKLYLDYLNNHPEHAIDLLDSDDSELENPTDPETLTLSPAERDFLKTRLKRT